MRKFNILIFIGAILLFNPVVGITDILPDAFGFALIAAGLFAYAKVDGNMADARRYALFLCGIGVIKLVLTPALLVTQYADDVLLATAAFAAAECVFTSLFLSSFFAGASYISERNGGTNAQALLNDVSFFTKLFLQLKIWLPVLPELTSLAADRAHEDYEHADDLLAIAGLKNPITLLTVTVALVLGIVWIIRITAFYRAVKSDRDAQKPISDEYCRRFAFNDSARRMRRFRIAALIASVGAVCFVDAVFDLVPVLFPALGIALFGVAALVAFDGKKRVRASLVCFACAAADLASEILITRFVPRDMVDIMQMDVKTALIGAGIAVLTVAAWACFMRETVRTARESGNAISGTARVCFTLLLIFRCEGALLPFLRQWLATPYFIVTVIFVCSVINTVFTLVNNESRKREND